MGNGVISYNSEALLQKKRVKFTPTVTTDTLKAGYVVCYNNDRTTDMAGDAVAEGLQNPARFLCVEKPKTANLKFVAGIVTEGYDGAEDGDWVDIYLVNGADIPVYTDQNCTNGSTTLAVTDGSYLVTAAGAANVSLGLAKETINRSDTNGLCLMKTKLEAVGDTSDYTTLSAAVSVISNTLSECKVSALDDMSDLISANTVAIASVETIASDAVASLHTYESALSDATSAVKTSAAADAASLATMVDSAISDLTTKYQSDLASVAKDLSDATSAVQASAVSDVGSVAVSDNVSLWTRTSTACSDAESAANSAVDSAATSLATMVDSAISDIEAVIDSAISDVVATNTSDNASIVAHCDSAILSTDTVLKSDIASIATALDSAISDVVATEASGNTSLATMVDSAISDLAHDAIADSTASDVDTQTAGITVSKRIITLANGSTVTVVCNVALSAA